MTGLVRHMTVLKETGQPGDVRALESYNMQGNYIRHYNYQARIDENVSPVEDSKFRIVPGLADTSAISFESVNFPGYYLRHKNDLIYLEKMMVAGPSQRMPRFDARMGLLIRPGRRTHHTIILTDT